MEENILRVNIFYWKKMHVIGTGYFYTKIVHVNSPSVFQTVRNDKIQVRAH